MKTIIFLVVLGLTNASPRRSAIVNPFENLGVPLPGSVSQQSSVNIPIRREENSRVASQQTPLSVGAFSRFKLPPHSGTQMHQQFSVNVDGGRSLPRSSDSQLNSQFPTGKNFGIPLPGSSDLHLNPQLSTGANVGISLPRSSDSRSNIPFVSPTNIGVLLPKTPGSQLNAQISTKTNIGIPLPKASDSRTNTPFASSANTGVPLPRNLPTQSNTPTSSVSRFGVPIPGRPLSSFNQNTLLTNRAQASPGVNLPLSNRGNVPSHRSSFGSGRFIVSLDSLEDLFSRESIAGSNFRSNNVHPLLRSTEEEFDDAFSRELFDDDDEDDILTRISLGRRFHPLGVPRRKAPTTSLSNNNFVQRNEPFTNPHIHKPRDARFFFDDSIEIDDDFDDDDDDDRKVIVNLSPSVRAFNHETSDEQLFLSKDTLGGYNFIDSRGAVNWGYKTDDQYQDHKVHKDGTMKGGFGWTAPEGNEVSINYVADGNGYQVLSSSGVYQQETPEVLAERENHFQAHVKALARLNPDAFAERRDDKISEAVGGTFDNLGTIGVSLPTGKDDKDTFSTRVNTEQQQDGFPLLINGHTSDLGRPQIGDVPLPRSDTVHVSAGGNIHNPQNLAKGIPLPTFTGKHVPPVKSQNDLLMPSQFGGIGVSLPHSNQDIAGRATSLDLLPTHDKSHVPAGVKIPILRTENLSSGVPPPSFTGKDAPQKIKGNDATITSGISGIGVPLPDHIEDSAQGGKSEAPLIKSNIENAINQNILSPVGIPIPHSPSVVQKQGIVKQPSGLFGVELPIMINRKHKSDFVNSEVQSSFTANDINIGVKLPVQSQVVRSDNTVNSIPTLRSSNINVGVQIPQLPSAKKDESILDKKGLRPLPDTSLLGLPILSDKIGRVDSETIDPEQTIIADKNIPRAPIDKNPSLTNEPAIIQEKPTFGVGLPPLPQIISAVKISPLSSLHGITSSKNNQGRIGVPLPSAAENEILKPNNEVESQPSAQTVPIEGSISSVPKGSLQNEISPLERDLPVISGITVGVPVPVKTDTISESVKQSPFPIDSSSILIFMDGVRIPLNEIKGKHEHSGISIPVVQGGQSNFVSTAEPFPINNQGLIETNILPVSSIGVSLPGNIKDSINNHRLSGSNILPISNIGVSLPGNIKDSATNHKLPESNILPVSNIGANLPVPTIDSINNRRLTESNNLPISKIGINLPARGILSDIRTIPKVNAEPSFVRHSGVNLPQREASPTQKAAPAIIPSIGQIGVSLPSFPSEKIEAHTSTIPPIGQIGVSLPSFPSEKIEAPTSTVIGKPNTQDQTFGVGLPSSIRTEQLFSGVPTNENPFDNLLRLSRSSHSAARR